MLLTETREEIDVFRDGSGSRAVERTWERVTRDPRRTAVVAIALSSLVRLVYVTYLGDDIGGPDGDTYDSGGWDFATGGLLEDEVTGLPYWPPGYPMLVGAHYALFGHHPYVVKLSQVVAIALLSWLVFRVADRIAGAEVGVVAVIGMSVSFAWIALSHPLMYEPWLALFLAAALWWSLRALDTARSKYWVGVGASLGLATAMSDKFLSLVVLLSLWLLVSRPRSRTRLAGGVVVLVLAGSIVALLAGRNVLVYGEPIVLANNHGINLVIGSGPSATGGYVPAPRLPDGCPADAVPVSSPADDRALTACSVRYIASDPGRFVGLMPSRMLRFWAPFVGPHFEPSDWQHFFDYRAALPEGLRTSGSFGSLEVILSAAWATGGLLLALLGAFILRESAGREEFVLLILPIAWLIAVHLVTFGDPRFRVPILPFLWMLQAVALVRFLAPAPLRDQTSS